MWSDGRTLSQLLQIVHNDAASRRQTGVHDPVVSGLGTKLHRYGVRLVACIHDVHLLHTLHISHRCLRHGDGVAAKLCGGGDTAKLARGPVSARCR